MTDDDDDLFGYFEEYDYGDDDEVDSSEESKGEEPAAEAKDTRSKEAKGKGSKKETETESEDEVVAEAKDEPPEPEPEPEPDPDPDSPEAIEALKRHKVRIDYNDKGMAWRVFLYEKCGDPVLALLGGLPSLKELWVIGSKCTKKGIVEFKEHAPKVTVY